MSNDIDTLLAEGKTAIAMIGTQFGAKSAARDIMEKLAQLAAAGSVVPTHRHIKRGTTYGEVGRGKLQSDEPVGDMALLVAYRGEDGALWFRPPSEFDDPTRFESIVTAGNKA